MLKRVSLAVALAQSIAAYHNCARNVVRGGADPMIDEWANRHRANVKALAREHLPSGSGIDNGCTVDVDDSSADKIVIRTGFHHMDESGCYDGWTDHIVTVTPSFIDQITIRVGGRDRNGIKEYLADELRDALTREVDAYHPDVYDDAS